MATHKRPNPSPAEPPAPDELQDERLLRIRERPDGYHWVDVEGRQEFGPYESPQDALAAMDDSEEALETAISQTEGTSQAEQDLDVEIGSDRPDEDESDAGPR
ncbi:MAG TPA: hypothetical protein VFY73_25550 [Ideonella sp.]|uniref:hypothetical protein n=1 Tax=Ideonella sp. TaxID=1929293 RepID=UPI002E3298D0|nr:hypothetical protein [Ideonella sp.]HEX5687396.1 hypothetical protein [Ideonella sp.]